MASISFKGEKLVGRSNYIEWLTNATLFLEINGFMPYIDGSETKPDKSLYYDSDNKPYSPELAVKYVDKESEFQRNNKKALGALKSIISIENTERFKDKTSATDLWNSIKLTFGESSLELIGRYLDKIIEARYSSYKNIDEYTSAIQSASIYLKELNYEVPKPFLTWLIFKGLPSSFDSFVSRKYEELAKDLSNIDISKLIADLISEEARMNATIELEANKGIKTKGPYCKHCNKAGHLESKCYTKYPELKPKKSRNNKNNPEKEAKDESTKKESSKVIMSAFDTIINYKGSSTKLILDSGATEHYTPNKDWLIDFKEVNNKSITIANGEKLPIKGIGNIPIKVNNKELLITRVNYIPNLKTTLISPKELTNKGWLVQLKGNKAILSHSSSNTRLEATWNLNAYYLNVKIDYDVLEPIAYKIDPVVNNKLDLYHKRLNHINKDYIIKTIEHTKGLDLTNDSKELHNCDSCYYGKFQEIVSRKPLQSATLLTTFDIDTAGAFRVVGLRGERYFFTIIDKPSRAIWIYPTKNQKADGLTKPLARVKFKEFLTQLGFLSRD